MFIAGQVLGNVTLGTFYRKWLAALCQSHLLVEPQSEVIRAIFTMREAIRPQSEAIRAIMSEDSPFLWRTDCACTHPANTPIRLWKSADPRPHVSCRLIADRGSFMSLLLSAPSRQHRGRPSLRNGHRRPARPEEGEPEEDIKDIKKWAQTASDWLAKAPPDTKMAQLTSDLLAPSSAHHEKRPTSPRICSPYPPPAMQKRPNSPRIAGGQLAGAIRWRPTYKTA